jgi:glycosyltransferase involved in cell wall biosynthesis
MNRPELSVVVLCYKTREDLIRFSNQLRTELQSLKITYEIILVANYDDPSDPTPQIAAKYAEHHSDTTIISQPKQGRMGWDMRSGLMTAQGKYVAVIDGDNQMPVSDIPVVYQIITTGRFDLVKTFRLRRYDGFYRLLLSKVYNVVFQILFQPATPVIDINSKPKLISRDALSKMNLISDDWFTDAEIMIEAQRLELRICQVATVFYKNERRPSLVGFGTIFEFIGNLFYYRFFKK